MSKWKTAGMKLTLVSSAAAKVRQRREEVNNKFSEISKAMEGRGEQLRAALENAQFNEKAERFETSLSELLREAEDESFLQETTNFERKIKAHKEFEDEINAQDVVKKDLLVTANGLIKAEHFAMEAISARKEAILSQWEVLLQKSAIKRQRLQECHSYVSFNRDSDETLAWIENNLTIATQTDVGDDLDTAKSVHRNFEEFKATLEANKQSRVNRVVDEALRLISEGHPQHQAIEDREKAINKRWFDLNEQVISRDEQLDRALLIHEYNRDVDEAISRIQEKAAPLSEPIIADDLRTIEELRRTHEALVIQTRSLEEEVGRLADEAKEMSKTFPETSAVLSSKQAELDEVWTGLKTKTAERGAALDLNLNEKQFISNVKVYIGWAEKISEQIDKERPMEVSDVASADVLLQRHMENKGKIEAEFGRIDEIPAGVEAGASNKFDDLVTKGKQLIENGQTVLEQYLDTLVNQKEKLADNWHKKHKIFSERRELLYFLRNAERVDAWIAKQMAILSNDDVGDSLSSVDKLLRKHENFEKSLIAQQEKMKELRHQYEELDASGHSQLKELEVKLKDSENLRLELDKASQGRLKILEASNRLQKFLRDAKELDTWMVERSKACGDNYQLTSSLRAKIEWQKNFQSELETNDSRFTEIRRVAQGLIDEKHFATAEVVSRQKLLDNAWSALMEMAKVKDQMLIEADKVQQLKMKVSDMEHWCHSMEAKLTSTEYGNSLQRIDNLLKTHILLEVDVAEYKKRVQAVQTEGNDLINAGNHLADEIKQIITDIDLRYGSLDDPMRHRHEMLDLTLILFQFYRNIDVEIKWTQTKISDINADSLGQNVTTVTRKQKSHTNLQSEVTTRQKAVKLVQQTATELVGKAGYTTDQIDSVKLRERQLANAWDELGEKVEARKQALADALYLQQYLADAAEASALLGKKLTIVSNTDYGSGEESESLLNKHETEVHNLKTYNNTIVELRVRSKSCRDNYPTEDTSTVQAEIRGAVQLQVKYSYPPAGRSKKDKELTVTKGEIVLLVKDTDNDWWKVKRGDEVGYIPANYVERVGTAAASHGDNDVQFRNRVSDAQQAIEETYTECLAQADIRHRMLDEAIKMHKLKTLRDAVDSWISDCEESVQVTIPGDDLEHNEMLQKQFDSFMTDLQNNEKRLIEVRSLGQGFIESGHSQSENITMWLDALNGRWDKLFQLAEHKKDFLRNAHAIHKFNRDVDEVSARFAEKDAALLSDDFGVDLSGVEALQRKFDLLDRDMKGALATKVERLLADAVSLCNEQPNQSDTVDPKRVKCESTWSDLQKKVRIRKEHLDQSKKFQLFLKNFRDISSWIGGINAQAESKELGRDQSSADDMLKQHLELQQEVDTRARDVQDMRTAGLQLINGEGCYYQVETKEHLDQIESNFENLRAALAARKDMLDQCCALQKFNRMVDRTEMWMSTQETPLSSTDYGSTLDSAESLDKKHAEFEKSLAAQGEQVDDVIKEAEQLIASGHYDAQGIQARKDNVTQRWQALLDSARVRKAKLADSLEYFQFLRDTDEVEAWMNDKMHVASDPSYKDPSNLQGKVQKHTKFEAEVLANEPRVFAVIEGGQKLISDGKGDAAVIQDRNASLEASWADLNAQAKSKTQKLDEAKQQQQYNLSVEDVEFWLTQVERLAGNNDLGKDLLSVQSLVKKHKLLVIDIEEHKSAVDKLMAQSAAFASAGHFDAVKIGQRCDAISGRYERVIEVAKERSFSLDESEKLQKLLRDIDDEESWIREKSRIASSTDFGRDLTSVEGLLKKHNAFRDELDTHSVLVQRVIGEADILMQSKHFAMESIDMSSNALKSKWADLQIQSDNRKKLLEEEVQHHEFLSKIAEEESWITEKVRSLDQKQSPDTLSTAEALSRKHSALEGDTQDHHVRVESLEKSAKELVAAKNRSSDSITTAATAIRSKMNELSTAVAQYSTELYNLSGYLQIARDADSIEAWIAEKVVQAMSDDLGSDLAGVEDLISKHESLHSSLVAFQDKQICDFEQLKADLIKEGNTEHERINSRHAAVMSLWQKLLGQSDARKNALATSLAKFREIEALLLAFAKRASEFNMWFENAEEDLSDPVHNQLNSLDEIQSEKMRFQEFLLEYETEKTRFSEIVSLDTKIKALAGSEVKNPYTWFTVEALSTFWQTLDAVIEDRKSDLALEQTRQEQNEKLRVLFAKQANQFAHFLASTRAKMTEGSGSLEFQLEETKRYHEITISKKISLEEIERTGAEMEDLLILDNQHTEHSTVQLAQLWDQLEQLGTRMQYNLEQQIEQKNASGVSEDRLAEIEEIFRTFDADGSGVLERNEVKSCLRASGMALPQVEEGEPEPEFEAVLAQMDPDGNGIVTMSEFKSFMISKETTNVDSSADVGNAFAQAAGSKPYITKAELYNALSQEQADYCIRNMKLYVDNKGIEVDGAYDYSAFVNVLFSS